MSKKINEVLRELKRLQKLEKVKFQKGKVIEHVSLLKTIKTQTIRAKYRSIPLEGERVHYHIAIGLSNITKSKEKLYKASVPVRFKPTPITKDQKEAWRKFGQGVNMKILKPYVEYWDKDYLYGYATFVKSHRKMFSEQRYKQAKNYLTVYRSLGAPDLTLQYFYLIHGSTKVHRLKGDPIYEKLKRLRQHATTQYDTKRIDAMIRARQKQFEPTVAAYEYHKYKAALLDKRIQRHYRLLESRKLNLKAGLKVGNALHWMEIYREKSERYIDKVENLYTHKYWSYIRKELARWLEKTAWGIDEAFMKKWYAKYESFNNLHIGIAGYREKHAYEDLIKWLIETGLQLPLHSTNLNNLKNPRLILKMKLELSKHFSQEEIDEYIKQNLLNPENLARSGLKDPYVDWHSQYGYMRETPGGAYQGQENEREITKKLASIESQFTKEYNRFLQQEKTKRDELERDFESFYPPSNITEHLDYVIQQKYQRKQYLEKRKQRALERKEAALARKRRSKQKDDV